MKRIYLSILVLVSVSASSQTKFYDSQRIDSLYGKFFPGSSTDSVVVVNSLGKFKMRNASAFGISAITADNGLTASTSTNVQLGGVIGSPSALLHDSYINTTASFFLQLSGSATYVFKGLNTGSGYGVYGEGTIGTAGYNVTSGGTGVYGQTADGFGVYGAATTNGIGVRGGSASGYGSYSLSASGIAIGGESDDPSTSTVVTLLNLIRATSGGGGAGANGIGSSINFKTATTTSSQVANQLISKLTDATDATYTSQFIITGVDAGTTRTLMSADGNGAIVMYGAGNPGQTLEAVNTSNNAIYGHTSSGIGVTGASISGYGVQAATNASSTNTILGTFNIVRGSTGTAANGIGASADYILQADNGSQYLSNQNISKWTTAANATRTSEFSITGVTSASTETWLTIGQSGYLKVRPMTVTEAGALTPAEGMIVFVSNTNGTWTSIGLWCYQNGAWHAL